MIEIQIFDIKDREYYIIEIDQNDKISTILDKVSEQEGIQRDGMRLFFRNRFLDDSFTYSSCEVSEDAVLQLYSPHMKYDEKESDLPLPNPSLGYLFDPEKS
ncbi:hypothetical protein M9Y10_005120 [Tritrichomonas musculus]|uniref:Ubiquitin-like domain-containing protein n=1 Tax=Tritrichomonas musculus TaxID=1915356 RepID=A0ABR2JKD5_9EUKA